MVLFQLLAGRVGVHAQRGMMRVVRDLWGPAAAAAVFMVLCCLCVATLFCEMAGVVAIAEIAGVPKAAFIFLAAAGLLCSTWMKSNTLEYVLLALGGLLSLFVLLALLSVPSARPDGLWKVFPRNAEFDELISAATGGSLTPFLLFYQSSAAVHEGVTVAGLPKLRLNIWIGIILSVVASVSITASAAFTLWAVDDETVTISTVKDAAFLFSHELGAAGVVVFVLGTLGAAATAALCSIQTFVWAFDEITSGVQLPRKQILVAGRHRALTLPALQKGGCAIMIGVVSIGALCTSQQMQVKLTIMAQDFDSVVLPLFLFIGLKAARRILPKTEFSDLEYYVHCAAFTFASALAIAPLLFVFVLEV